MIVSFAKNGKSFKGLSLYLSRDPKAETADRLAWTHTLNLSSDHVALSVHEMYQTFLDAELLKEEAGIRKGGRPLEKPVKHFSLDWHPDDHPTKEHMIASAEAFIQHMGWQEHQAILYAHDDKSHDHVHVMMNAVHPETGLKLDEGLEWRRAQEWALAYERGQEQIRCEQRLKPGAEREAAPSRKVWEAMQEGERQHQQTEAERAGRFKADEPMPDGDAWKMLKELQREEREAFFASGKDAYRDARNIAFREVREEFREDWKEFYEAKRAGLDPELLAGVRAGLVERQNEVLAERRDEWCSDLRAARDENYVAVLAMQKVERAEFGALLAQGGDTSEWLQRIENGRRADHHAANANEPILEPFVELAAERDLLVTDFQLSRMEVCQTAMTARDAHTEDHSFESDAAGPLASDPRVKDPLDLGPALGAALIGSVASFGEKLLDGFLDDTPAPKAEKPRPEIREVLSERPNPFAVAADAARRSVEAEAQAFCASEWGEERRSRARD